MNEPKELAELSENIKLIDDELILSGKELKAILVEVVDFCEYAIDANRRKYEMALKFVKTKHEYELKQAQKQG